MESGKAGLHHKRFFSDASLWPAWVQYRIWQRALVWKSCSFLKIGSSEHEPKVPRLAENGSQIVAVLLRQSDKIFDQISGSHLWVR